MLSPRLLVLLVASSVVVGCGTNEAQEHAQKQALHAEAVAREHRLEAGICKKQIGPFVKELGHLNSHLDVGLNYSQYTEDVGNVRSVYDEIPFKEMKLSCLSAGIQAEDALKDYAKAVDTWSKCQQEIECTNDSIKPTLQKDWSAASLHYERAVSLLSGLSST